MDVQDFAQTITFFYHENRRDLEWRRNITPYKIVVSEIMLQQTQVLRVSQKFPEFVKRFPNFESLVRAPVAEVLDAWQGMGYNRRALYLKKIAERIMSQYSGKLPNDPEILETFPGIGHATACSIVCFSWNIPTVFIETNIRRVFLHFFFPEREQVHDKEIYPLVEQTLDRNNPREWYFALMDYGSILPKTVVNPNRRSTHYAKQSAFEGSVRKVRGMILKVLLTKKRLSGKELKKRVKDDRFEDIMRGLIREGFVRQDGTMYSIYEDSAS